MDDDAQRNFENEEIGLEEVGATAVNAASVEEQILRQVDTTAAEATNDLQTKQEQLWAVRREVRAVRSAVQQMEQPATEQPEYSDDEAGTSTAAPLAQGELQQAVMRERLAGLEKQAANLENTLAAAGIDTTAPDITQEAVQEVLLKANKKKISKKEGKKARTVQFQNLQDDDLFDAAAAAQGRGGASLVETERDRLIRLGVLTPFDRLGGFERRVEADTANGTAPTATNTNEIRAASIAKVGEQVRKQRAERQTTKLVGFSELPRPQKHAKKVDEHFWRAAASGKDAVPKKRRISTLPRAARRRRPKKHHKDGGGGDDNSEEGSEDGSESSYESLVSTSEEEDLLDQAGVFDDADEDAYHRRQKAYMQNRKRKAAVQQQQQRSSRRNKSEGDEEEDGVDNEAGPSTAAAARASEEVDNDAEEEESEEPEPIPDVIFEGGYRVPGDLYSKLFDYQRTGVKWLWELYTQRAGGIIGDEMGLGKTIQIIGFLAGLHHSGKFRASLVICPATVLNQWLREIRSWYPPFRVAILHESAAGRGGSTSESRSALVRRIASSDSGILLTTYEQLRIRREELLPIAWGCVILDEGHKIRNPDAEVTLVAKQLATVHRLIMTGSPIQNRLTELWSLFDFVFPGKLGTLPIFQAQFAVPIQIGGYANASPLQVAAAYRCAVVLRDLISPYLLRRRKSDVASSLPKKTERVLFCSLTQEQRDMYRSYLASKELGDILAGNRAALAGIDILRKICNHPDLLERAKWEGSAEYGDPIRSGKLQVLDRVLGHWHEAGHKALVFTQTQQMLDILERLIVQRGWKHHRMDGNTPIASRSRLMDDFNNNPEIFVFLLTTRVGGLGVNLTGANRCVIFDPDWNPSTDIQARERAWRIGQSREVTVYRLITSGTIEEKVYHRQVYKQFLTDKVLRDPRQKRFFKARDLSDLFTLGDEYADGTETAEIFASLDTELHPEDFQQEEGNIDGGGIGTPNRGLTNRSSSDRDDFNSDGEGGGNTTTNTTMARSRQSGQRQLVTGAAREEEAVTADPSTQQQNTTTTTDGGDAQILKDLFDGTGVHAAIDHDKIESAHDPSHRVAEKEAAKIAKRAADALRQSRLQLQQVPVNQPTWTGRSGAAGAPRFGAAVNTRLLTQTSGNGAGSNSNSQSRAGFGVASGSGGRFGNGGAAVGGRGGGGAAGALRSSELLARMRERQAAATAAATTTPEVSRAQNLATRVAGFISGKGGSAPSAEVAAAFQRSVSAGDLALFKSVLKQVATLQRQGGAKLWVLRPEFVPDSQ
jgi:DNA excision repair protein ERCC-6